MTMNRIVLTGALLFALPAGTRAQSGFIDVGEARIYYEAAGQGPAVVFIHGWALGMREWDDQVAALTPRFRVVAFDRRGYGRSTGFADISADAGDLRALLDSLGIGRAILVGHSAGAQVVYRFAAAFPERTAGLVLYGGGLPPRGFPIAPDRPRPNLRDIARRHGLDSVLGLTLSRPEFSDLRVPHVEARIRAMWAAYTGKDLLEDHPPSGRFPNPHLDQVKRWSLPTLFITGDTEDPHTRLIGDSLARWMPNARSVVVPGGGHGVHFLQPERFNTALLAFLGEIRGQSGVLDVGDARIYYETAGQGPAVVFIHGWALNLREWDDQVGALAPRFRTLAVDRRGFGRSTGFADVSADPGDVRALLDTLHIGKAVLVGHSAGTQVAYRFASAFPERVEGLVLYGAGTPPEGFPIPRGVPREPGVLRDIARRFGLDSVQKVVNARPAFSDLRSPAVAARIDALWAAYSGRDLLEDHPQSGRFPPARFDDVKRWPFPVLFVAGDTEAPHTRLIGDSLARWMPNARSVIIPGGGHGVHFRQPERFNAELLAFLNEIGMKR